MTLQTQYDIGDTVYFFDKKGNIDSTTIKSVEITDIIIYNLANGLVTNNEEGDLFESKTAAAGYWLSKQGLDLDADLTSVKLKVSIVEAKDE